MDYDREHLTSPNGDVKTLLTFRKAQIIYDLTFYFAHTFLNRTDRTIDQMIQAARSGKQNIAEGSAAGVTSMETAIKLTNVAKASQEELLEDYRSFLRQRNLPMWDAQSAQAHTVRQARPENLTQLRQLMACLVSDLSDMSDKSDKNAVKQEVAANTMICLSNQETFLLARQISRLAADFEKDGGFTERLYRIRSQKRKQQSEK